MRDCCVKNSKCTFKTRTYWPLIFCCVDCSPPGSSVHGILQARILERVAIAFSRGFSQPRVESGFPVLQVEPREAPLWYSRSFLEKTFLLFFYSTSQSWSACGHGRSSYLESAKLQFQNLSLVTLSK